MADQTNDDDQLFVPERTPVDSQSSLAKAEPLHAPTQPEQVQPQPNDSDNITLQGSQHGDTTPPPPRDRDNFHLTLKDNQHRRLTYKVRPDKPMKRYMRHFADEMRMDYTKLRFLYDGERLMDDTTPEQLNMDNGDTIDVYQEAVGGGDKIEDDYGDLGSESSWSLVSNDDDCVFPDEATVVLEETKQDPGARSNAAFDQSKGPPSSPVRHQHPPIQTKQGDDAITNTVSKFSLNSSNIGGKLARPSMLPQPVSRAPPIVVRFAQAGHATSVYRIGLDSPMGGFFVSHASLRGRDPEKLKFTYRGKCLTEMDTPNSLGLPTGCTIVVLEQLCKQSKIASNTAPNESPTASVGPKHAASQSTTVAASASTEQSWRKTASNSHHSRINISVRSSNDEQVYFKLKRTTSLRKLFTAYAEHQQLGRAGLRFLYDGQQLQDKDTAEELAMPDNAIIDVHSEQVGGGPALPSNTVKGMDELDTRSDKISLEDEAALHYVELLSSIDTNAPLHKGSETTLESMALQLWQDEATLTRRCAELDIDPTLPKREKIRQILERNIGHHQRAMAATESRDLFCTHDGGTDSPEANADEPRKRVCPPTCKYCAAPTAVMKFTQDGHETERLRLRSTQRMALACEFYACLKEQEDEDLVFLPNGKLVEAERQVSSYGIEASDEITVMERSAYEEMIAHGKLATAVVPSIPSA